MAIRRCPYCKAIIDEGSEYCSNCGTQLIFPEDEFVEEEIPGEKVKNEPDEDVESEEEEEPEEALEKGKSQDEESENSSFEESDKEVPLTEAEDMPLEEKEASSEDESEADFSPSEELGDEQEWEGGEEESFEDKEIGGEEIPEKGKGAEIEEVRPGKPFSEYFSESDTGDSLGRDRTDKDEDILQEEDVDEVDEAAIYEKTDEISQEPTGIDFKTEDLESIIDPAEKEKEEIERFLDSLKEEREKAKKIYEETGELPPWAASMKESSSAEMSFEDDEERLKETAGSDTSLPPSSESSLKKQPSLAAQSQFEQAFPPAEEFKTPTDTGMGLPEKVEQQDLPFEQRRRGKEPADDYELRDRKSEMKFTPWIKSRVFDVLVIVGLWLITIWLASLVAGVSFFRLISGSTLPVLLFLAILLFIYFFLFFFFLGETLGDHLFSQEE